MQLPRFRITERQFLLSILVGLMCTYCAAFLMTLIRPVGGPVKPKHGVRVHLLTEAGDDVVMSMFDPSLMSLPDAHGFSGVLWKRGPRWVRRETDWGVKPSFWEVYPPEELPSLVLPSSVETTVRQTARKPLASFMVDAGEPAGDGAVFDKPVFVVTSGLIGRLWREGKALMVVTNEVPLRSTRMRIAVDGKGNVRFANIEEGCGNESADSQALEAVRWLKFAPLEGRGWEEIEWGQVKVLWVTVLPAGNTNSVSTSSVGVPSP